MALTEDEKTLRRKVVGCAVRRLREYMGISQTELGRRIDGAAGTGRRATTDGGSVCRWEKGEILPNEWKRRELIRMAEKCDRNDLAALLDDPLQNWRAMLDKRSLDFLTLLEICMLNQDVLDRTFYEGALTAMADQVLAQLMQHFTPERRPVLLDDHQRALWAYWRGIYDNIERDRKKIAEQETEHSKEDKHAKETEEQG
jgi:hypothetical protein